MENEYKTQLKVDSRIYLMTSPYLRKGEFLLLDKGLVAYPTNVPSEYTHALIINEIDLMETLKTVQLMIKMTSRGTLDIIHLIKNIKKGKVLEENEKDIYTTELINILEAITKL